MMSLALSRPAVVRPRTGPNANAISRVWAPEVALIDCTSCLAHASDRPSPTAAVVPPSLAPLNCLSTILTSPMPAAQRFGTWADQDGSLSRSTDAVLWESAISVLPLGALSASLLKPRIPASTLRVEQPLLCMARPQGRRMRHADRRSAKSILAEQRAVRQGGSETVGRERGKRQAQAFQFSTPIHTATCSPHLVPYTWLTGPRHHQSAGACERLGTTWSFMQVTRFKAWLPGGGMIGVLSGWYLQAAHGAAEYAPPTDITRAGRSAQVLASR